MNKEIGWCLKEIFIKIMEFVIVFFWDVFGKELFWVFLMFVVMFVFLNFRRWVLVCKRYRILF